MTSSFLTRRRRGSVAIEAAVLFPMLILLFGGFGQYMAFAKARNHAEFAAYAAARSALVHMCEPLSLTDIWASPVSGLASLTCDEEPSRWEDAARWALIPAAPASAQARARGGCAHVPAAVEALRGADLEPSLEGAFANRLCYVFEPGNVEVDVRWRQDLMVLAGAEAYPIVEATVRFRYQIHAPIAQWFSEARRGDGTTWRMGEATVVLS